MFGELDAEGGGWVGGEADGEERGLFGGHAREEGVLRGHD